MFRRTSKIGLAVAAGLFVFAVACTVEATQEPSSPAATGADQVDATAGEQPRSAPSATPTPQFVPGIEATTVTLSPGATPTASHDRPSSPTPRPAATSNSQPPTAAPTVGAGCGGGPVLTHSPMALDTFTDITPLGNLNPPSHTFPTGHMYFGLPFEQTGGTDGPFGNGMVFPPQELFAAADASVVRLAVSEVTSTLAGEPETYREFGLHLEVCDGTWIRYGHIGPLSDRLESLIDSADPMWCNEYSTGAFAVNGCEYSPGWKVEAGEFLAYTSGRAAAFDFGASTGIPDHGERVPSCPLDLYDDQTRKTFESRLGDGEIMRTAAPVCGVVNQDLPGTAQGRWYQTLDRHPQEDNNVALVHDNFDPAIPVFSIGKSVPGLQSNAYRFVHTDTGSVNRDFADVTPGSGVICYEGLADRWGSEFTGMLLLVEMTDENTLRIEAVQQSSCGGGPWTLSSDAATYLR